MSFTDLWRCKRCNELPEILFRGKNFLIKCKTCNSRRAEVFANSLDEVVVRWNKKNNPIKTSILGGLAALPGRLKDFFEYQFRRSTFTPAPAADPAEEAHRAEEEDGDSRQLVDGRASVGETMGEPSQSAEQVEDGKMEAVEPQLDSNDPSSSAQKNRPETD